MKKFLFVIFLLLPVILSISAGQNQDTIPPEVKKKAMAKTDRQIDSLYSVTPADVDALQDNFRALRDRMDSINAQSIIREERYDSRSRARDSIIRTLVENYVKAQTEANKATKTVKNIEKAQNFAMLFILMIAASYFGYGINRYFHKKKCNE